ncbi:sorting nexin 2B-like isoform X1 [Nymphaea colorata]|nr:sorting nexin 2B-like isoform X1 [Nymphaea colorata]
MMRSDNHEGEEAHPLNCKEDMESLALDAPLQPLSLHSCSDDYRSAISSVGDGRHPLSPPGDPILSPFKDSSPKGSDANSFLEPPSYADVVFRPFENEHDDANNGYNGGLESCASPSSDSGSLGALYLRIAVTDPQKEQEMTNSLVPGGNTYITYLISTRTNIPEFGGYDFSVRRRFRDVVTLADRLAESYRGFFIPPRPDKNVVESQVMQKQEFVEQRRVALEKYLCRLAAHPVINKSEELRLFLQVQGRLPLASTTDVASRMLDGAVNLPRQLFGESVSTVSAEDVAQPAKGGRDLLRIFKELKQSVANDWGSSKPPIVEEDKEFLEKKEKMLDLEQQLSDTSQQAETLVKAQQDIGETMGKLGLAFIQLTKLETDMAVYDSQTVRAAGFRQVATAAVKASRFYRELNAQSVKHLDKLHEYLGLMQAVHSAFSDRSSALLTVQTLLSELSSMNLRAEKLEAASSRIFGADKTRNRRLEELRETIRVTEESKSGATKEYERIKENNRNELERLDRERTNDFFGMLRGFAINQAGYAEKVASVWAQVAEETREYEKDSS